MDSHSAMILEEYDRDLETLTLIKDVVMNQIQQHIKDEGLLVTVCEGRVKSRVSLAGKLDLKGYKYDHLLDITDIFGGRIVTFYDDQLEAFATWVQETFEMDWENSIDKRKLLAEDQFGYMSLHYICRVPQSLYYDEAHPLVNEYRFELQLRTALQHVWATIFHDTGYKSDVEVPRSYIRGLNRLAGLLELADEEFLTIRKGLDEYRDNIRTMLAEGRFDEMGLDGDGFRNYLTIRPFDELTQRIASINNAEISDTSLISYLPILQKIGFTTIGDIERMKQCYSEGVYRWNQARFEGTDIDIIASSVALRDLCILYLADKGLGYGLIVQFLRMLYPTRKGLEKSAQRMYQQIIDLDILPPKE